MSEWLKIALTALATIVGGVAVFALTKILERIVLDPVNEQRKLIGEIDVALTYWAWAYVNPDLDSPVREKAVDEIRSLASRLAGVANSIRWWRVTSILKLGAINVAACHQAASRLIGISNQMRTPVPTFRLETGVGTTEGAPPESEICCGSRRWRSRIRNDRRHPRPQRPRGGPIMTKRRLAVIRKVLTELETALHAASAELGFALPQDAPTAWLRLVQKTKAKKRAK